MAQVVDLRKIKKTSPATGQPKSSGEGGKKIKIDTREYSAETKKQQTGVPSKIEWTAPEFTKYKKEKSWFISLGIIILALIVIAIILKNFLLVIGLILAAFVIYIYAQKEPRKIQFSISGKGIRADQNIYKFEDLKSFWIFYNPPEIKELSLRSKKMLMPYIRIPLEDQNPVEMRKLLLKFLPERRHKESIIDTWARRIRF